MTTPVIVGGESYRLLLRLEREVDMLKRAQLADAEHIKGLSERVAALEARLANTRRRRGA